MLSVRDLVRQIPAEWQENVKHRARALLRRLPRPDPRPRAGHPDRRVVLGGAGDPRDPRPLGRSELPPRAGAPGHRAAARRRRPSCSGSGSARPSASTASTSTSRASGQPVARRARDHAAAPHQPEGERRAAARATTGRWSASCWRTRPCRGGRARRGSRCRRSCTRGSQELSASWIAEIEARRYDVIGDLGDLVGAPPVAEYADPDQPGSGRWPPRRVDAITALLLDNARGCARRGAAAGRARRRARRARAGALRPDVPRPREGSCGGWRAAASAAGCSGSTGGRGAGARGRRSGRPAR